MPESPIGPYPRLPLAIRPPDPGCAIVARMVAELVAERRANLVVEHLGSTAVPGLAGKGVVDLNCKVHGTTNVLVTDASTFTSCIRVNAQLTTMAMAHYATAQAPFGTV